MSDIHRIYKSFKRREPQRMRREPQRKLSKEQISAVIPDPLNAEEILKKG
jgi:hypothetical protein